VALAGYPFASALPFVPDERQRPVFLISRLAEHSQNLLADPRASLLLALPEQGGIESSARTTVVGKVAKINEPRPLFLERYLRYRPAARDYLQLDFVFFRLEPVRIRVIGGFGQAGWLEGNQLRDAPSITLEQEARALEYVQDQTPGGISLLGVDAYGIDYVRRGHRRRGTFDGGAMQGEALAPAVLRLVQAIE
jgi:putative heme iron utilization protein